MMCLSMMIIIIRNLLLLLLLIIVNRCDGGGKIDGIELLIGDWDTTIQCTESYFRSVLFPPKVITTTTNNNNNEIQQSATTKKGLRKGLWGYRSHHNHQCKLSVYPNGTFYMKPNNNIDNTDIVLPIHGIWKYEKNPYCVTDRFYDEIQLIPYTRIQKQINNNNNNNNNSNNNDNDTKVLQKLNIICYCRLYGHFSSSSSSKNYHKDYFAKAKLTHGYIQVDHESTATIDNDDNASSSSSSSSLFFWKKNKKKVNQHPSNRQIKASFRAIRKIPTHADLINSFNIDIDDDDEFDYD